MVLPDINSAIHELLESKRRVYQQYTNRISSLDEPCERLLYYQRAAWANATPISDDLAGVFETGNALEPIIARIAAELGDRSKPRWRIVGNQMPVNDKLFRQFEISGTIDGILQVELEPPRWTNVAVLDGKTMSPNVYPQVNTYDDLGRYRWTRKYRGQLGLYALAFNLEDCVILATNKSNIYQMKFIHWKIDLDYLESLLKKAERINAAVKSGNPPDGINDPDACPQCPFYSYCCPNLLSSGNLKIVDNGELEAVLQRMAELAEPVKEHRDLEKARDIMLTRGQDIVVGPFIVKWKETASGQFRKSIVRMK